MPVASIGIRIARSCTSRNVSRKADFCPIDSQPRLSQNGHSPQNYLQDSREPHHKNCFIYCKQQIWDKHSAYNAAKQTRTRQEIRLPVAGAPPPTIDRMATGSLVGFEFRGGTPKKVRCTKVTCSQGRRKIRISGAAELKRTS